MFLLFKKILGISSSALKFFIGSTTKVIASESCNVIQCSKLVASNKERSRDEFPSIFYFFPND